MRGLTFLSGVSVGAGLMYLMDPDRGEDRRAELRDTLSELGESELVGRAVEGARGLNVSGVLERPAHWWSTAARQPEVRRGAEELRRRAERLGLRRQRRSSFDAGDWALVGGLLGAAVVAVWLARRAVADGEGFEVSRSVTIDAPVERVWDFWSDFENFPRFMSHVREVRRVGSDRTHWVVAGPAGAPIEWDAVVTQRAPNDSLSWRTVEGALVDHSGTVRFRPAGANATRVDVRLHYRPMAGALGHGVASLFGSDPERVIDDDLARLASQLRGPRPAVGETGSRR